MFNERTANVKEIIDEAMRVSEIIHTERMYTCEDNDLMKIFQDTLEKLITDIQMQKAEYLSNNNFNKIENKLSILIEEYKDIYVDQCFEDCKYNNYSKDVVEDFIQQSGVAEELKSMVIQLGNIKRKEINNE